MLVRVNWKNLYWRAFRSPPWKPLIESLFSPLLLQLEELRKEITKQQQNTADLGRELEEKSVNEITALKESHQGEMAELESRLRDKHEEGIALLEQQYQVGAMIFMTECGMVMYENSSSWAWLSALL